MITLAKKKKKHFVHILSSVFYFRPVTASLPSIPGLRMSEPSLTWKLLALGAKKSFFRQVLYLTSGTKSDVFFWLQSSLSCCFADVWRCVLVFMLGSL